jgi:thiol-disulfide isomerase/thioredoxin
VYGQDKGLAPKLDLKDINGKDLRLGDFKGKVVLVNFWATWCPPCRTEIPELIRWQRAYGHRRMQIIGVTYPPQTLGEVRSFIRKAKINYPVALGTEATKKLFTSSDTLPMTAVIDAKGNLREVIEGIVFKEEFEQKIKPLLTLVSSKQLQRASIRLLQCPFP